ncbi:hypothetical protein GCM10023335_08420 [Streptomyces siamensis]|uniref:Uncharacterized protein n=1 Tax=Streptomyces siamensis TaxID=1274986 RepID=A0ABP9IGN0_9ACTN
MTVPEPEPKGAPEVFHTCRGALEPFPPEPEALRGRTGPGQTESALLPVPPRAGSQGAFLVPVRIPPTGSGRASVGQRLNRCEQNEQNHRYCGAYRLAVRSAGTRTTGGPLKAPRCTRPGTAISGNVPQDIPRCQSRPPRRF